MNYEFVISEPQNPQTQFVFGACENFQFSRLQTSGFASTENRRFSSEIKNFFEVEEIVDFRTSKIKNF